MAEDERKAHPPLILGKQDPMIALDFAEQLRQSGQSALAEWYLNIMFNQTRFRQTGQTMSGLTEAELEAKISSLHSELVQPSTQQANIDTRRDQNDPPTIS